MKTITKITALVSTILLSVALAGPANAATSQSVREVTPATPISQPESSPITAEPTAKLSFERTVVTTTPAAEAPAVVADPVPPVVETLATPATQIQAPVSTPAPVKPTAPTVSASGKGAAIAAAAYAQLGVAQDCTALVSNSLRAVGINFHGWPADYLSLGTVTSSPQPGDLIYYANGGMGMAHIAVYVGNGMAVHGGWNGGTTALYSANVGSGPVYIHVA